MDEARGEGVVELEQDEITDSINRLEKSVSKLNAKIHMVKILTQEVHDIQTQSLLTKIKKMLTMEEPTRLAVLVSILCGVVSASIVWLLIRIF